MRPARQAEAGRENTALMVGLPYGRDALHPLATPSIDKTAKKEIVMIIKQNKQYELHATLQRYNDQHSLTLSQRWPKALHPHQRQILQVLLSDAELATFAEFLATTGEPT
jgi:hypothetical protein